MATFFVNFFSDMLKRTVSVNVILPTDKFYFPGMPKREEGKPYKTLYLLHGVLGNNTDWLHGTRIQRWAEEKDLALPERLFRCPISGRIHILQDFPWAATARSITV